MTITQLGEARHPSPISFSFDDEIFSPADVQWPGGKVPDGVRCYRPRVSRSTSLNSPFKPEENTTMYVDVRNYNQGTLISTS